MSVNDYGQYLNVASSDGNTPQFTDRGELEGAGAIGRMLGRDPTPKAFVEKPHVVWASVKTSFFASIFTADKPGVSVITRRIDLPPSPARSGPTSA